ncbi:MAG: methyltransferase domain-containing protein [Rhizobiaceae bacterium]|nr:methyltransferase domain-containing protein [Rhizobiaceae bacterium]
MFCCSDSELAQKKRFEDFYSRSNNSVMLAIERQVCGCDFGGNSWTIQQQADDHIRILGLKPGVKLIDLGAGSGWPGIYMAKQSGCDVTLVDLPEIALKMAVQRAQDEGVAARVSTCIADAADLPHQNASFNAISHSDLLCCLIRKRGVLEQCRRIIRPDGIMAFTVISIAPGLSRTDHARALENAPEFAEMDGDYLALLKATHWEVSDQVDLTGEYQRSCERQIEADEVRKNELVELFGETETEERIASWHSKRASIRDGLFVRELFVCKPDFGANV